MVNEQITLGDLIGACIAAGASLIGAFIAARTYYIHHRPFKMFFADKLHTAPDKKLTSSLTLPTGRHCLYLSIRLSEGRNFEVVGIRFVRRNWMKMWWMQEHWEDISGTTASVSSIADQERVTLLGNSPDGRGGRLGTFHDYRHLLKDAVLWLTVWVEANKSFRGYLSFEHKRGDNYRGFVRRRVKIGNPPAWLERIGRPAGIYYEYPT